jgi:hypothetical protein
MLIPMMLAAVLAYPALNEEANRALANAPREIGAYAERRAECEHWGGEEPYDKARGRQIAAAVRALRCERLEADGRVLRKKYAGRPALVRLLAAE